MIGITSKGDFKKTTKFLERINSNVSLSDIYSDFDSYGRIGVDALSDATPVDTGLTANSWRYRVIKDRARPGIEWYNTNTVNGTPIAILIQYGYATGSGGYVQGRDYINPAMRPIFDMIAADVWKKVKT